MQCAVTLVSGGTGGTSPLRHIQAPGTGMRSPGRVLHRGHGRAIEGDVLGTDGPGWVPAQANHPETTFCEQVHSEDIAVMLSSTGRPEEFRRTTITVTNPEMSIAISATNRVHFRTCDRAINRGLGGIRWSSRECNGAKIFVTALQRCTQSGRSPLTGQSASAPSGNGTPALLAPPFRA